MIDYKNGYWTPPPKMTDRCCCIGVLTKHMAQFFTSLFLFLPSFDKIVVSDPDTNTCRQRLVWHHVHLLCDVLVSAAPIDKCNEYFDCIRKTCYGTTLYLLIIRCELYMKVEIFYICDIAERQKV